MPPSDRGDDASPSSTVEAAIDGLYRLDLEDFVGKRNALAKQLKDAGDAAHAKQVRACKKPSLSAWAVNRLWWDHAEAFAELRQATQIAGEVQRSTAGPYERSEADQTRRRAHQSLMDAASTLLSEHGHAASAATLRKIGTSLEAIAARDLAALDPAAGRLTQDLDPPGFDLLSALASMGRSGADPTSSTRPRSEASPVQPDARALAQAELDRAQQRALEASRAADEADRHRAEVQVEYEAVTQSLRAAKMALDVARQNADRLEKSERIVAARLAQRTKAAQEAANEARRASAEQSKAEQAVRQAR